MLNPKLGAVQRQSAVERYLKDSAPAAPAAGPPGTDGPEAGGQPEPLVRKCYCILRGRIEALPSLELRNRQGKNRLFDWDGVTGANLDDPGRLVLHVQRGSEAYTVTITGRGLDRELKDGIGSKRVVWIEELEELAAAAAARADPTEPVVTGIHIVKGSVSSEW